MDKETFKNEFIIILKRAIFLMKTARHEGLLALEECIDEIKLKNRNILEYGIKFVIDGTDGNIINKILSNIIDIENDKEEKILKTVQKEAVMSIQTGDHPRIMFAILNSYVDFGLENEIDNYLFEEENEHTNQPLRQDEIDALLAGINTVPEENMNESRLKFSEIFKKLEKKGIQAILRQVYNNDLAIALKNENEDIKKIVFENMSNTAVIMLKENMEYIGPIRISDIIKKQNEIINLIKDKINNGEIIYHK